ncbi:MAG TPA: DUF3090 family protein [Chloroflexota bacterium]|nr:DUF3090 family protein [Chloroflexota bacterium]
MNERSLHVGLVDTFAAQSFGEPGQRTFRVFATTHSGEVSVWMEKEQLVVLGEAIGEMLQKVPDSQGLSPASTASTATISGEVAARAGSLALTYDEAQDGFVFEAANLQDATLRVQSLSFLLDRHQLAAADDEIQDIVAASRPRCTMCGQPLTDPAHFCPPSNGHARVQAPS